MNLLSSPLFSLKNCVYAYVCMCVVCLPVNVCVCVHVCISVIFKFLCACICVFVCMHMCVCCRIPAGQMTTYGRTLNYFTIWHQGVKLILICLTISIFINWVIFLDLCYSWQQGKIYTYKNFCFFFVIENYHNTT